MLKRIVKRMLILAGVITVVLVLLLGVVLVFLSFHPTPSTPLVAIHAPAPGDQFALGQLVAIQTTSRDENNKIEKVELWEVSGERLRLVSTEIVIEPEHVFSVPQGWQPLAAGSYRLIVRAFNDQGGYGQAAVDVEVVEEGEVATTVPRRVEGDILPAPGGFDPEQPDAPGGGMETAAETGATSGDDPVLPPQPDPPLPNDGFDLGGLIVQGIGDLVTPEAYYTWVEFEALDFEVTQPYDRLYCYVSLEESPFERVPESGFLDATSQLHWNIETYLGGDNSVVIPLFGNQKLDFGLVCNGFRDGQHLYVGWMNPSHPAADWNGEIIQKNSVVGEGFTVSYRINPVGSDLEAPVQLHQIQWGQQTYFHWSWDGDPAEIDGFRLYRDDTLVASLPANTRVYQTAPWWTVPPCGEEYRYHVVAYRDTMESAPSNFLRYKGGVCKGLADITYAAGMPNCNGTGQRFVVKYNYPSPDPAFIGIRAFKDGQRVERILSTHTQIQSGSGTAQLALTYHGTESLSTDRIDVYLYDQSDQYFYVESFDREIEWAPGEPDLIIQSARVDRDAHKLVVGIWNAGCASPPADNPVLKIVREADGWTGIEQFDGKLYARSGANIAIDLMPDEMNLWGGEVTLTVDPMDDIEESNNGNNSYLIGSARIKAVQFYKIDVLNTHDDGKGEFYVVFYWNKQHQGEWEQGPSTWREYQWGEGEHAIGDLFYYPILEDKDIFRIRVGGFEIDDLNFNDWIGEAVVYHSPDPRDENSWKRGGEFSAMSDMDDYIIYYRIILE